MARFGRDTRRLPSSVQPSNSQLVQIGGGSIASADTRMLVVEEVAAALAKTALALGLTDLNLEAPIDQG